MKYQEWRATQLEEEFYDIVTPLLAAVMGLDMFLFAIHGYEVTVTDVFREPEKGGFHPLKKAVDIRSSDMSTPIFESAMAYLWLIRRRMTVPNQDKQKNPRIEAVFEKDEWKEVKGKKTQVKWQHIHIEYDDGNPLPRPIGG